MTLCELWPHAVPSEELEHALADLLRRADGWAGMPPAPARLIPWIAERLGAANPAALAGAPAADLHLACACADGDARAQAHFESVMTSVRPALASLGAGRDEIDEVCQRLRVQLLVGDQPGIAAFGGRGELRAWVRVVAVRETARLLRQRGRAQALDDERMLDAISPGLDAERDLMSEQHRLAFRAAFAEAIQSLPARARLVLRQHAVDDLSIDQIGAAHGVHRATAARWIEQARGELSTATERGLQRRLALSAEEVRDLLRLMLSRLDASVHRLLGSGDG